MPLACRWRARVPALLRHDLTVTNVRSGRAPAVRQRRAGQLTEMCTWSKWFAVAEPRSGIERQPSEARTGPDLLRPEDVVQVELGGVRARPVGHGLAEGRVADHEVDGPAGAVLAVAVVAAVRRQRRERVADRAEQPHRRAGQARLGAGAVGQGAVETPPPAAGRRSRLGRGSARACGFLSAR